MSRRQKKSKIMMPPNAQKLNCLFCSPRAVNYTHGTGVQISYITEQFPTNFTALNFGHHEHGVIDAAYHLENSLVGLWPFKLKGRRSWIRGCENLGISYWRKEKLAPKGQKVFCSLVETQGLSSYLAVLHDEFSARRFDSILKCKPLRYSIILYDFTDLKQFGCTYSDLIANASSVFVISQPLADVAQKLGASRVERIGFFRPPTMCREVSPPKPGNHLNILVLAYAAPQAVQELYAALRKIATSSPQITATIHLVGNHPPYDESEKCTAINTNRYGVVSSAERDRIASMCDVAYLAGPCEPIDKCPFARYSLPSKLGDFLAVGLPTIARVAPGSAAELTIIEDLSPFVRAATSEVELFHLMDQYIRTPGERSHCRSLASKYAEQYVNLPGAGLRFVEKLAETLQ